MDTVGLRAHPTANQPGGDTDGDDTDGGGTAETFRDEFPGHERAHGVTTLVVPTQALAAAREALDREVSPDPIGAIGATTAEYDQEAGALRATADADLRVALGQMLTGTPADPDQEDGLADFLVGAGDLTLLLECVRTQRTALRGLRYGSGRHSTGTQDTVGGVLYRLDDLEHRLGGLLSTAARASR